MDIQSSLASRVTGLKASAIREIFKMVGKADVISFAGGIPSPEIFPIEETGIILKDIMEKNSHKHACENLTKKKIIRLFSPIFDFLFTNEFKCVILC